ncbi:hypothetical protein D9Q98_006881 [Chlorella vulgaris]|uniref:Rab-GAP TBC domain-containing protein n=1 Tax=Chlorella vulgaris TaxID=3077 RepID=A0A9D4TJ09_CHLVU|nr:hypothetical protein D9Q98_006881 [Chlorella vulgaris]
MDGDEDWEASEGGGQGEAVISRRFSLTSLTDRLAKAGETIARKAAAAGELVLDRDLRTRSAALLAGGAGKAAKGLVQGAERIAAGPRAIQGILQKLQLRIEEQRLNALLQEQQDAPVDVQVAFQLYEDAPQDLRSRLWIAVLEHPELCNEYQALTAVLQRERQQAAVQAAASGPASPVQPEPGALPIAAEPQSNGDAAAQLDGSEGDEEAQQESSEEHARCPDAAHLAGSYSNPRPERRQDEDGWQLVTDQAAAGKLQGQPLLARAGQPAPYCAEREGFRNILMTAMMSMPWPLPREYPADCRYATLLQISVGQEAVNDEIERDVGRTFPETAFLAAQSGQQALFRVLRAYALIDMEVGYCQGMAFCAGCLLFYVPEEPAFQIFCRLMSTSGPNLRRFYLPGLEGLKDELRKLEFLTHRYLGHLTAHLNAAGVVPVLYASQWLLTCFSCPFPVSFSCRLIDIMLQEDSDSILLKTAVAILAECEGDLLMQEDFESLLTYLKIEPAQWSPQRLRRVLNAAVSSPIGAQDLADAEAALRLGEGSSHAALADHAAAAGQQSLQDAAGGSSAPGAAADGGEDDAAVAELAAAQQQIDDELMEMVLKLDLEWGSLEEEVGTPHGG